jgi:hypothetical protein
MKFPIRKVSTLLDTGAWQLTPALPLPTIQPTTVAVKVTENALAAELDRRMLARSLALRGEH